MTRRHSSAGYSSSGWLGPEMPALLTRMSGGPSRASVAASAAAIVAGSVTSQARSIAPAISAAADLAAAASTSQIATRAPEAAKRSAIARPMPRAAPVTIATRPAEIDAVHVVLLVAIDGSAREIASSPRRPQWRPAIVGAPCTANRQRCSPIDPVP